MAQRRDMRVVCSPSGTSRRRRPGNSRAAVIDPVAGAPQRIPVGTADPPAGWCEHGQRRASVDSARARRPLAPQKVATTGQRGSHPWPVVTRVQPTRPNLARVATTGASRPGRWPRMDGQHGSTGGAPAREVTGWPLCSCHLAGVTRCRGHRRGWPDRWPRCRAPGRRGAAAARRPCRRWQRHLGEDRPTADRGVGASARSIVALPRSPRPLLVPTRLTWDVRHRRGRRCASVARALASPAVGPC